MIELNSDSNNTSQRVFFYGRTLQEYIKMFDLDLFAWRGCKILDCPAGPASFVAEARRQGLDVVGCDPLYTEEPEVLADYGKTDIEKTIEVFSRFSQPLSQKFYPSLNVMKEYATSAFKTFVADYQIGKLEKRYIPAALPNLPFDDFSFDLVTSGNFLFIYSNLSNNNFEQLDYQFHRCAVLELLRVSKKEVRIFPVSRVGGQLNEYAEKLLSDLEKEGITAHITQVGYEIMQGGNLMLRLTR